jgi:hypothetical protein
MSPLLRKSAEHYKAFGVSLMARINATSDSEWKYKNSIKSHTILLRPGGVRLNTAKDYDLSKVGVLYQEQGTPHFIVRYPIFNRCCYCGCCFVITHYFHGSGYCGCWNSTVTAVHGAHVIKSVGVLL